ncbi:uncharacterized protein [Clytia hemisphaerica]|uniref:Cnidarian restricted protein n=1 Tax=Clytia hemisphaerica TaxID=252671 RepID=A0A7M5V2B1_9CNID|eukprot:TCONS_00031683-protein
MTFKLLIVLLAATIAAAEPDFRDDIRELGKLDQNQLYDALKHEHLRDHVELDDEDHEFLSQVSKDELKEIVNEFSNENTNAHVRNDNIDQQINDDFELSFAENDENDENEIMEDAPQQKKDPIILLTKLIIIAKKVKIFLLKHGEKIKAGIRALRRAIWHCCKKTKRCKKWWCKFGKK